MAQGCDPFKNFVKIITGLIRKGSKISIDDDIIKQQLYTPEFSADIDQFMHDFETKNKVIIENYADKQKLETVKNTILRLKAGVNAVVHQEIEGESNKTKEPQEEQEDQDENYITNGTFLNSIWGKHNAYSKSIYIDRLKAGLMFHLFKDFNTGQYRMGDDKSINQAIKAIKLSNINIVKKYLELLPNDPKNKILKRKFEEIFGEGCLANVKNGQLGKEIDSFNLDFKLIQFRDAFKDYFKLGSNFNTTDLGSYFVSMAKGEDTILTKLVIQKLKAFEAFTTLNNFDNLLSYTLDFIKINPKDRVNKYSLQFGTKVTTSWRDDTKDYDETKEFGSIPTMFLSSMPLFNVNTTKKIGKMDLQTIYGVLDQIRTDISRVSGDTIIFDPGNIYSTSQVISDLGALGDSKIREICDEFRGKTLSDLIKATKGKDGLDYYPLLFYVLTHNSSISSHISSQTMKYIYSLYKNLFELTYPPKTGNTQKSLLFYQLQSADMLPGINTDYYCHILQLLNSVEKIDVEEINVDDNGDLKRQGLSTNYYDKQSGYLKNSIEGTICVEKTKDGKKLLSTATIEDNFDVKSKEALAKQITITIPTSKDTYKIFYKGTAAAGEANIIITNQEGKNIEIDKDVMRNLGAFLHEVYTLPFNDDAFLELINKTDYDSTVKLAAEILYSYSVSAHILKHDVTKQQFQSEANGYYNSPETKKLKVIVPGYLQLPIIVDNSRMPMFNTLVEAYKTYSGNFTLTVGNDLGHKQLNTMGLPQLMTKAPELWYDITKGVSDEDVAKFPMHSFLIQSAYNGISTMRDAKSITGEVKKATEFNFKEYFTGTFLCDFLGGADNMLRILPAVISDKSKIPILEVNGSKQVPHEYFNLIKENHIGAQVIKYSDLTTNDLRIIMTHDFGDYYLNMYKFITTQYDKLNSNITNKKLLRNYKILYSSGIQAELSDQQLTKALDYRDNFDTFNKLTINGKLLNATQKKELLHQLVYNVQQEDPSFEITDTSFFSITNEIRDENGEITKEGQLQADPVLIHDLILWNKSRTIKDQLPDLSYFPPYVGNNTDLNTYFKEKNNQVVSDLLKENFDLNLRNKTGGTRADLGSTKLIGLGNKWYNQLSKQVVLANLNLEKGEDLEHPANISITSKQQFKDSIQYKQVQSVINSNDDRIKYISDADMNIILSIPKENLDIENSDFNFNDFITVLNIASNAFNKGNAINSLKTAIVRHKFNSLTDIEKFVNSYSTDKDAIIDLIVRNSNFRNDDHRENTIKKLQDVGQLEYFYKKAAYTILDKQIEALTTVNQLGISTIDSDATLSNMKKAFAKEFKDIVSYSKKNDQIVDKDSKQELTNDELVKKINDNYKEFNLQYISTNANSRRYSIEINPLLEKYNAFDFLFGEEYLNSTVGSYINHPCKKFIRNKATSITEIQADKVAQQVKRNVGLASPVHQELTETINGSTYEIRICSVEDLKNQGFNVQGDYDEHAMTTTDGITFTSGLTSILENNSLESQAVGVDKKDFGTYYNPKTGLGFILKTSGDAITNERIIESKKLAIQQDKKGNKTVTSVDSFMGNINKHLMNTIKWNTVLANFIMKNQDKISPTEKAKISSGIIDWTKSFYNHDIKLRPVIVKHVDQNGIVWYELRSGFLVDPHIGQTSYYSQVIQTFDKETGKIIAGVYEDGKFINNKKNIVVIDGSINKENISGKGAINSNWQLWKYVLGGENSAHIDSSGEITTVNDNTSFQNLATIANHFGYHTYNNETDANRKITSQRDVFQLLKQANIDYMATEGAIKQGSSNPNSTEFYDNENYNATYMTVNAFNWGIQLDAEHTADNSLLSLMTQVVNALGARGYTGEESNLVYKALHDLTEENLKDIFTSITDASEESDAKLRNSISNIIINSLKTTTTVDGNLVQTIANQIVTTHPELTGYDKIKGRLPISHPAIMKKVLSSISAKLTKAGVTLKFDGSMCVLCPSDGIRKIYGGKTADYYRSHPFEFINNIEVAKNTNIPLSKIQIDRNYFLYKTSAGGERTQVDLNSIGELFPYLKYLNDTGSIKFANPYVYWAIKKVMTDPSEDGSVYTLAEDISTSRDLGTYNCTFNATDKKGHKGTFCLWDLDVVKELYQAKTKEEKKLKYAELQTCLNAIGNRKYKQQIQEEDQLEIVDDKAPTIRINKEEYSVINGTTSVVPYELVAPKIYQTQFGLREGDELSEIEKEGNLFFLRRALQQKQAKMIADSSAYTIDISKLSGDHIYLKYDDGKISVPKGFYELNNIDLDIRHIKGQAYRFNQNGEKMYAIPVDEDGNPTIRIFSNGENEVIATKDLTYFLDQFNYSHMEISDNEYVENENDANEINRFENIAKQISDSTNRTAQNYYKYFLADGQDYISLDNYKLRNEDIQEANRKLQDVMYSSNTQEEFEQNLKKEFAETSTKKPKNLLRYVISDIISSREVFTSFEESLKFVASRTPAQSHQSFMPMRIVVFTNTGLNSAYVSRWQLWLQGSDYDIDKVSLLGKTIRGGKLSTWSSLQRLDSIEDFKKSQYINFPTGKEVLNSNEPEEDIDYLVDEFGLKKLIQDTTGSDEAERIKNIKKKTKEAIDILYKNGTISKINELLERAENAGLPIYTASGALLAEIVNRHNLTFSKKPYLRENAIKNYISYMMYKCTLNPSNLIQAQTGIDTATSYVKQFSGGFSKSNPESKYNYIYTRRSSVMKHVDKGAVTSKIKHLVLTLSGKMDVSIAASAMKNFEALSNFYCAAAAASNEGIINEKDIGGLKVSLLANTHSFVKYADESALKQALDHVDTTTDAFILLSVLMSLATDNAKDPQLAMINAGPEMIGFYTSGIMLGIPFNILVRLMLSDTGLKISELTSGNILLDKEKSSGRADVVLNYLQNGPKMPAYVYSLLEATMKVAGFLGNEETLSSVARNTALISASLKLLKSNILNTKASEFSQTSSQIDFIIKELSAQKKAIEKKAKGDEDEGPVDLSKNIEYNTIVSELHGYYDLQTNLQHGEKFEINQYPLLNKLQAAIKKLNKVGLVSSIKGFNDTMKEKKDAIYDYITQYEQYRNTLSLIYQDKVFIPTPQEDGSIIEVEQTPIKIFRELSEFTKEVQSFNAVSSLNSGLPNKIEKTFDKINTFESILKNRLKGIRNIDSLMKKPDAESIKDPKRKEIYESLKALNAENEKLGVAPMMVSAEQFAFDPRYRAIVIRAYGSVKYMTNVYDVISNSSHYFGYFKALMANFIMDKKICEVVRSTEVIQKLLSKYPVKDKQAREDRLRKIMSYIQDKINREFFKSQHIVFTINNTKDSNIDWNIKEVIKDNGKVDPVKDTQSGVTIDLSTVAGRQTFKEYMDTVVFPNLKSSKGMSNGLTSSFGQIRYNLNPDHSTTINWGLSLNTNPQSANEIIQFQKAKADLDTLTGSTIPNIIQVNGVNGMSIANLIYLYNMISYNGTNLRGSFTSVFEDLIGDSLNQDNLIGNHIKFISDLDSKSALFDGIDPVTNPTVTQDDTTLTGDNNSKQTDNVLQRQKDIIEDEILRWTAPMTSIYQLDSYVAPYCWVLDEYNKYKLVKYNKKEIPQEYYGEAEDAAQDMLEQIGENSDLNDIRDEIAEQEGGGENSKNKQLTLDTATGEDMTYSIVTNSVNNKKLSTLILGNSDFETLINTKNNMFKVQYLTSNKDLEVFKGTKSILKFAIDTSISENDLNKILEGIEITPGFNLFKTVDGQKVKLTEDEIKQDILSSAIKIETEIPKGKRKSVVKKISVDYDQLCRNIEAKEENIEQNCK